MNNIRPSKIWVLYGGNSSEREVSIKTGLGILAALESKGFETKGYDVKPGTLTDLPWKEEKPDLVYIALHGHFGEDGAIQGFLDAQSVLYVGSGVMSSAVCFHKGFTKNILKAAGIAVPLSYDFAGEEHFLREDRLGTLPDNFYKRKWFIKPAQEGSTIGIERYDPMAFPIEARKDAFYEMFCTALKFCEDVLIEEWIEGPEMTVPVFSGRALPAVEIRPKNKFYNYESKYTVGETEYLCPAPVNDVLGQELADISVNTFHALKCVDLARVDLIVSQTGPVVLEMNTLPGMTETSLVPKSAKEAGMEYADFVEKLVCASYKRQVLELKRDAEAL